MASANTPIWITVEDAIAIHDDQLEKFGGAVGIKSQALLESALAAPLNHWYINRENSMIRLAAQLAFSLVKNHPFVDGNKRTATIAFLEFLYLNGLEINLIDSEQRQPLAELIEQLAASKISAQQFAETLRPFMSEVAMLEA